MSASRDDGFIGFIIVLFGILIAFIFIILFLDPQTNSNLKTNYKNEIIKMCIADYEPACAIVERDKLL